MLVGILPPWCVLVICRSPELPFRRIQHNIQAYNIPKLFSRLFSSKVLCLQLSNSSFSTWLHSVHHFVVWSGGEIWFCFEKGFAPISCLWLLEVQGSKWWRVFFPFNVSVVMSVNIAEVFHMEYIRVSRNLFLVCGLNSRNGLLQRWMLL